MTVLAAIALALAVLPLALTLRNLALFKPPASPSSPPSSPPPPVSVLIPARNEERVIERALGAALASEGVELEVVVLDDHSDDRTAALVEAIAGDDPRARLEKAPPLPPGWSGKQHACHALSSHARFETLVFVDADVRLAPDALARLSAHLRAGDAALVSGFPRELTGSFGEALIIPLIHLLLLGYLPMDGMRRWKTSGFSAGCGQLMGVRRAAYIRAGGHAAIRASLHDGIMLPRAFRKAGFMTDIVDATALAQCRMYRGFRETWAGFAKNATEGMARPLALPVWTVLLLGGHVLPWLLLVVGLATSLDPDVMWYAGAAAVANIALRVILAIRFEQSVLGVLVHPVSILVMLALQWTAFVEARLGRTSAWRGRSYPAA